MTTEVSEEKKVIRKVVSHNTKKVFFRRRLECPLCKTPSSDINYKNPDLIKTYTSEGGRILPKRITNVCSKQQRLLKKAIKISRVLGLLPFVYQINK